MGYSRCSFLKLEIDPHAKLPELTLSGLHAMYPPDLVEWNTQYGTRSYKCAPSASRRIYILL